LLNKIDFTVMGSPPLTGDSRSAAHRPLTSFPLGTEVRRQGALRPCSAGQR
jgi:hypothetical protein